MSGSVVGRPAQQLRRVRAEDDARRGAEREHGDLPRRPLAAADRRVGDPPAGPLEAGGVGDRHEAGAALGQPGPPGGERAGQRRGQREVVDRHLGDRRQARREPEGHLVGVLPGRKRGVDHGILQVARPAGCPSCSTEFRADVGGRRSSCGRGRLVSGPAGALRPCRPWSAGRGYCLCSRCRDLCTQGSSCPPGCSCDSHAGSGQREPEREHPGVRVEELRDQPSGEQCRDGPWASGTPEADAQHQWTEQPAGQHQQYPHRGQWESLIGIGTRAPSPPGRAPEPGPG